MTGLRVQVVVAGKVHAASQDWVHLPAVGESILLPDGTPVEVLCRTWGDNGAGRQHVVLGCKVRSDLPSAKREDGRG